MKVLIADDEQIARARLLRLLQALPDIEVVGEAKDGNDVLTKVRAGGIGRRVARHSNAQAHRHRSNGPVACRWGRW